MARSPQTDEARRGRFMDRLQARLCVLARPATGFVSHPEPRTIGSPAKGRQLMGGNFLFAGHLVARPGASIWEVRSREPRFEEEIHGFGWLDDLAAVGTGPSRDTARRWLWEWIDLYGNGRGPGWVPELAGRRLIRWIAHAIFLLRSGDSDESRAYFRSLGQQVVFLSRRWRSTPPGLPRFEALTGLIYAGLALEGFERLADPAIRALGRDCATLVDGQGGIPTRNPEELLEVLTLLIWAATALDEAGRTVGAEHRAAIQRIAPTLRTLRHSDGALARFHGGGRGLDGRLDHALAESGVRKRHADGLAMGFARISAGRTSVVIDAAPPPTGRASRSAHASTLAFELTSGRRPLIVNCGSGVSFGDEWRRAGRATPSHSTLCLDNSSTGRLAAARGADRPELLVETPARVPVQISQASDALRFEAGHDGYVPAYGLTHVRRLDLSADGRALSGEDTLMAIEAADKRRFDRVMDAVRLQGVPFDIRFHLHPDVDAAVDMGGAAVSMALRSGEIWVFRHDGRAQMRLDASVYLEKNRLKPRATKQIVLSGRAMEYATRIRWSLAKAQETPVALRDLARTDADEMA